MSNGTPKRVMGNGEGFTTLILTDAESRILKSAIDRDHGSTGAEIPLIAWCSGIRRATDRIKAEFDEEQKRRKDAKK